MFDKNLRLEGKRSVGWNRLILVEWSHNVPFLVTKVSEFSEARSFSYPELINGSFDFSGFI